MLSGEVVWRGFVGRQKKSGFLQIVFQDVPQLAVEMLEKIVGEGVILSICGGGFDLRVQSGVYGGGGTGFGVT
jgi:hypothetical protein